jgi:hypothetical protein
LEKCLRRSASSSFEVRFNLVHELQEKHYRIKEFSLFWAQTRVDQENGRAYAGLSLDVNEDVDDTARPFSAIDFS